MGLRATPELNLRGRGARLPMLDAEEHERVLGWLCDLSGSAPFDVKATAAPQYRRIVRQRSRQAAGAGFRFPDGLQRPGHGKGVNDGRGFMFISHTGEVMPSGLAPPHGRPSVRRSSRPEARTASMSQPSERLTSGSS